MKKIFYLVGILLFLGACTQTSNKKDYVEAKRPDNKLIIRGKVTQGPPKENSVTKNKVFLYRVNPQTLKPELLSTKSMTASHEFEFELTVKEPTYVMIQIYKAQVVNLLLNKSDVFITADGQVNGEFKVTGCQDNDLMAEYEVLQREIQRRSKSMKGEEFDTYRHKVAKKFINKAHNSLMAIAGTNLLSAETELDFMKDVADDLEKKYPNSLYIKRFRATLKRTESLLIGKKAPDFSFMGANSDTLQLSDLEGKYVFIDFWSTKTKGIYIDNKRLEAVYQAYKDKDFEMISICIDQKEGFQDWVKAKENLSWKQIWDSEKLIARSYNAHSGNIPLDFLLDKEGKIIKKGLRGLLLSKEIHKLTSK